MQTAETQTNEWEQKFQAINFSITVARHTVTEKERIEMLRYVKELINEMIRESEKSVREKKGRASFPDSK